MRARWMVGALASALLLVGCGSSAADEGAVALLRDSETLRLESREHVIVEVTALEPIRRGKNTILVEFPGHADVELEGVSTLMPAHGHGSPTPTVEPAETGYYVRDLVLYMSGRWELRLALRRGEQSDEAIVAVDIP